MRHLALAVAFVVGISACGSAATDSTADSASSGNTEFQTAFTCAELADRWQDLQQRYLDRLGDASAGELEDGSARVDAAGRFIAQAMQEQARDVDLAGCGAALFDGSPPLCDRIEDLAAGGPAASRVLGQLADACPNG